MLQQLPLVPFLNTLLGRSLELRYCFLWIVIALPDNTQVPKLRT